MPQQRLSNDEFLSSLTNLFNSTTTAAHGSVFLTQKPMPVADTAATLTQVLIRATNGAALPSSKAKIAKSVKKSVPKVKLATVVEAADLDSFYAKYAEVCKKSMEGLRKRDKKKAKEKAKAAKKKKGGAAG